MPRDDEKPDWEMKYTDLGATFKVGERVYRVTRIYQEPDTGLLDVDELRDGEAHARFRMPVAWVEIVARLAEVTRDRDGLRDELERFRKTTKRASGRG